MTRKGESSASYNTSFDEFYAKKLEAIKVQLKGVIYGDTPFVTSQEYACKKCQGRLKLHAQGRMYCLVCGEMPPSWSKQVKACVAKIMEGYPDQQQCVSEWQSSQTQRAMSPQPPAQPSTDWAAVAFGARVEEARAALGWTQEELASKIVKQKGGNISSSTINMVERGLQNCSPHVREQLERVLGLKERIAQG